MKLLVILGPGSVHKSGGVYRWAKEVVSVVTEATQAPSWTLDRLCRFKEEERPTETTKAGSEEELFNVLIHRFSIKGFGERNNQTTQAVDESSQELLLLIYRSFERFKNNELLLITDHQKETCNYSLHSSVQDCLISFAIIPFPLLR